MAITTSSLFIIVSNTTPVANLSRTTRLYNFNGQTGGWKNGWIIGWLAWNRKFISLGQCRENSLSYLKIIFPTTLLGAFHVSSSLFPFAAWKVSVWVAPYQHGKTRNTIGAFAYSRLKILKHSVASTWTHGRNEEVQLGSGWILIGSELSSSNFDSVRAERSFAMRYCYVVIKPLCGNLDICLNY